MDSYGKRMVGCVVPVSDRIFEMVDKYTGRYKPIQNLGVLCEVFQNKNEIQNRYGFVLIN
jgi:hypothetical protein